MQSANIVHNYTLVPIPSPTASAAATAKPSFLLLLTVTKANPPSKTPNLAASVFSSSFIKPNHSTVSHSSCRRHAQCSSSNKFDSAFLSQDDEDDDDDQAVSEDGDGDIEKTGNNCRRIRSEIGIEAPLNTVWNLLTDYERLADFIPGLAVCRLLHKTDNYARLFQIGQQNLAFGLKFNAKGVVDCYETPLETLPNLGHKRDIEFNMVEGDFEIFQGKWSLQQLNREISCDDSLIEQQMHTTLSYLVDVKPKLWLPIRLVEGRLCKEIKINLACIREEALKLTHSNTMHHTR
ncbi:uncharacterized protein Pyn_01553 [Prunus yedoensis var. nudiflora]|uniref:Coenzyme Q-binding protein COQ10 START domain-containing protein n=1 Tax=Prunus yedoensis var. nudiflora TaxID=2094558 RepID=A0A314Z031_PRUYE|nr:uncharacterized protein Pyn_01553 [Prunus yedoensis var. nudiflora]